jgi:hypothetical protein
MLSPRQGYSRSGYLLVGADDCVAPKVIPPTLHVRVQVWLDKRVCPQLEKTVSTTVHDETSAGKQAHPYALDIILVRLNRTPSKRGQPQG